MVPVLTPTCVPKFEDQNDTFGMADMLPLKESA